MNNQEWASIENLFDELITMQEKRVLSCGRNVIPNLTQDDILQPNDYIELENHPTFRYEEGVLIGIRSAFAALNALQKDRN